MKYQITYESTQGSGTIEFDHNEWLTFIDIQFQLEQRLGFIPKITDLKRLEA